MHIQTLANISNNFWDHNLKQTGINRYVYEFSVDFGSIDVDDIVDTHKYSMKKNNTK